LKEHNDLEGHIHKVTITDDQVNLIEAFCAKIREGLDQADFNTKRHILELLDVRGKIAFENGERILYLKCLLDHYNPRQVSRVLISPLLSIGAIATKPCACLSMVPFP